MNARLPFGKTYVILIVLPPLLAIGIIMLLAPDQMVLGSEQLSLNRFVEPGNWFEIGSGSASGRGLSNTGSAYEPTIAADADGKLALVWTDSYRLYARYWNGQEWTQLGSLAGEYLGQQNPAIALGKDGWAVVAWNEYYGIGDEIVVKQWDGEQWSGLGGGGGIISNRMGATHPAVAIAPDNKVYVAWHDSGDIYALYWDGRSWLEIGPGSASGDGISGGMHVLSVPSLALDSKGYPTIAWNGQSEVVVTRWTGSEWIKLGTLKTTETSAVKPALTFLAVDSPIVAWQEQTASNVEIYVRRWNGKDWVEMGSGSASGGGVSDNIGNSLVPALASNANGSPILVWQDDTSDSWQIYARMWNGSSWNEMDAGSASGKGISAVDGSSKESRVALDAAGKAYVVWSAETAVRKEIYGKQWLSLPYVSLMPAQEVLPGSGWQAGIQVHNSGAAQAVIDYTGIAANGTQTDCGEVQTLPGASANFLTYWGCPAGHPSFSAGVVRSDQPGAAIASIINAPSGMAGGQYRGMDAANASEEIFFPLVKHNHNGRTTAFSVQNTGDQAAEISAVFKVNEQTFTKSYTGVPAKASVLILPADAGVPAGFGQIGSLTVTGTHLLAGAALEHAQNVAVAENLQASTAFTPADFDSTLFCPLVRNGHTAKKSTSGVQVQNVSAAAQTVTFTYTPVGGGPQIVRSKTISPGASATFFAPSEGIPAGSLGAVVLEGSDDIVAVVNERGVLPNGRLMQTTYACFAQHKTSNTVLIPLYKEFYKGNSTGIQIQNVSGDGQAAVITLEYQAAGPGNSSGSATFSHKTPLADGASITFWGVSELPPGSDLFLTAGDPGSLEGTYGSVVVTSDRPIVAIVNESAYGPAGSSSNQDSKNYEGFNVD